MLRKPDIASLTVKRVETKETLRIKFYLQDFVFLRRSQRRSAQCF